MKKNLRPLICLILALLMLPVRAFAYNDQTEAELLSGVAAVDWVQKNADFVGSELRTVTNEDGEQLTVWVDTYTKTVVVETIANAYARSGVSATEYETTTYELWNIRAANGSGSVSEQDYDNSGSVLLSLTVNYTDVLDGILVFRRMTRVSGYYTVVGYGAEVLSHSYTLGEMGTAIDYNHYANSREYSLSRTQTSWSASVNSTLFPAIQELHDVYSQGADYNCRISSTETGGTWTAEVKVRTIGHDDI